MKEIESAILVVLLDIRADVRMIVQYLTPKPITKRIAVRFTGARIMPNNVLVFNVGQQSTASILPLSADGVTPSGGTLSNVAYAFSDPSATVVLNPDGLTATCTGVSPSSGPVTGTATCTVTDTDGVVSQWSQAFTIQTNAAAQQTTQSVAVQFSTPTGGQSPALKAGAPKLAVGATAPESRSH